MKYSRHLTVLDRKDTTIFQEGGNKTDSMDVNIAINFSLHFHFTYACIKANGEFGYMAKMKINIYFLLMQNFIELYELLMPC